MEKGIELHLGFITSHHMSYSLGHDNKDASLSSITILQTLHMLPPRDSRLIWTSKNPSSLCEDSPSLLFLSSFGRQEEPLGLGRDRTMTLDSKKQLQKMGPSSIYPCKIIRPKVFRGEMLPYVVSQILIKEGSKENQTLLSILNQGA